MFGACVGSARYGLLGLEGEASAVRGEPRAPAAKHGGGTDAVRSGFRTVPGRIAAASRHPQQVSH